MKVKNIKFTSYSPLIGKSSKIAKFNHLRSNKSINHIIKISPIKNILPQASSYSTIKITNTTKASYNKTIFTNKCLQYNNFSNIYFQNHLYSTESGANKSKESIKGEIVKDNAPQDQLDNISIAKKVFQKVKEFIEKNGKIGLITLLAIDVMAYLGIYFALLYHLDIDSVISMLPEFLFHYKEYLEEKKEAGSINYAVIAFIIWKMIGFLRVGLVTIITPVLRNVLERVPNKGRVINWLLQEIKFSRKKSN